jgi:hypothetical protein
LLPTCYPFLWFFAEHFLTPYPFYANVNSFGKGGNLPGWSGRSTSSSSSPSSFLLEPPSDLVASAFFSSFFWPGFSAKFYYLGWALLSADFYKKFTYSGLTLFYYSTFKAYSSAFKDRSASFFNLSSSMTCTGYATFTLLGSSVGAPFSGGGGAATYNIVF